METIIIENENQYIKYMNEMDTLVDLDPQPTSSEGKRLLLLSEAIGNYEKNNSQLPDIYDI